MPIPWPLTAVTVTKVFDMSFPRATYYAVPSSRHSELLQTALTSFGLIIDVYLNLWEGFKMLLFANWYHTIFCFDVATTI